MSFAENPSRRHFIKSSATLGTGLVLGIQLTSCGKGDVHTNTHFKPNVWLSIASNNQVNIILSKAEMGQGVMTALTMLIAEELDANWKDIKIQLADADDVYGSMLTVGSSSIQQLWLPLRSAGATAREMLLMAGSPCS